MMPIYMQYDGVQGSVTAPGFERHAEAQTPSVSEVVVTKATDVASTNLFRSMPAQDDVFTDLNNEANIIAVLIGL